MARFYCCQNVPNYLVYTQFVLFLKPRISVVSRSGASMCEPPSETVKCAFQGLFAKNCSRAPPSQKIVEQDCQLS